ncbi:hypothetical protein CRYUN_Cryun14cG0102600 [Craigia yunnanensis]
MRVLSNTDDIVCAENEVAALVHVSKVVGENVITNGFNGTIQMFKDVNDIKHHENSKLQVVKCLFYFDTTVFQTKVKNCHAIAKAVANQTSSSTLPSAQDVSNGHYGVSSNDFKSSPSRLGDRIGAFREV